MTFATHLPLALYALGITTAEVLGVVLGPTPSTTLHALLILIMLSHYTVASDSPLRCTIPALVLAPLLRILSYLMPLPQVSQLYWHVLIGLPLLVAAALVARLLHWSPFEVRLTRRDLGLQLLIGLTGLPLGIIAWGIQHPEPLIRTTSWPVLVPGVLILSICSAFAEELIFRGLLQHTLTAAVGRAGIVYTTVIFTSLYIGSVSLSYVLFVAMIGLYLSWCVQRTGSIWGVVLTHACLISGLLIVWPFTFGY